MRHRVGLGDRVRCRVSGFVGIATSRTEYLNGCFRIGVQPSVGDDNKNPEVAYFDEPQLGVVKVQAIPDGDKITGGVAHSIPPSRDVPR